MFIISTGGRTLSPHRSRLHPDTLEAIMCSQHWLWATSSGGIKIFFTKLITNYFALLFILTHFFY